MSWWFVGKQERVTRRWVQDGTPITTGTATVQIYYVAAGQAQYLQVDGTSFSTAPFAHALALTGSDWVRDFDPPASAKGYTLTLAAYHSAYPTFPLSETVYVSSADLDAIYESLTGHEAEDRPTARFGGL